MSHYNQIISTCIFKYLSISLIIEDSRILSLLQVTHREEDMWEDMDVFILLICDFEVTGYTTKYDTHNVIFREGACVMVNNINMKDGQEGIKSFVEKRKPVWSHTHE